MVFSPVPLYLDPPNWQQHSNQQQLQAQLQNNNHHDQNQHNLITPPQQQPQQPGISGGIVAQQSRASSMSERARIAKIPPPEIPLKCPRCDSSNTKFCYYNNYSLTQPRHFCKTCRRYWTRGGALRNVPVGGGCRRNKRTSSKSSSGGGGTATSIKSSNLSSVSSPLTLINGERLLHHNSILEQLGHDPRGINVNSLSGAGNGSMSFLTSLQNMAQLGGMNGNMSLLPFSSGLMHTPNSQTTPLGLGGSNCGGGSGNNNSSSNYHQQNLEYPQHQVQFPNFLAGFDIPSFHNVRHQNNNQEQQEEQGQGGEMNGNNMSKISSLSMTSGVKMEENGQEGLNLRKQLMMGISNSTSNDNNNSNNNQFWGGSNVTNNTVGVTTMWTDLSGLNSSSTTHLL